MTSNSNEPRLYDAILGGQLPSLTATVSGGLDGGIQHQLGSDSEAVRIAALLEALKYGEEGIKFVLEILNTTKGDLQRAAYDLLWERGNEKDKQRLANYELSFEFEVVTVDRRGEINSRCRHEAKYIREDLGGGVFLDMVYIPGGSFEMGSPEADDFDEEDGYSYSSEQPQHRVTMQPYYMGKYPITQAQWQAVANLPTIQIDLNPDPSYFKGKNRPVERVNGYEAMEFCARLSQKTGKNYGLPSEAEWEYGCRAGTTTPFHFGETITGELANYYATATYAEEPEGQYREQTTPVGSFPPNAFGLYDMYGNVREWCADPWHRNYEGAPTDGTVWHKETNDRLYTQYIDSFVSINRVKINQGNDDRRRLLRGGSWFSLPWYCRSASRGHVSPHDRYGINDYLGFRAVYHPVPQNYL